MIDIKLNRKRNIKFLANQERFKIDFANKIGISKSQLSQLMNEESSRNLGNKTARHIENLLQLDSLWLDIHHEDIWTLDTAELLLKDEGFIVHKHFDMDDVDFCVSHPGFRGILTYVKILTSLRQPSKNDDVVNIEMNEVNAIAILVAKNMEAQNRARLFSSSEIKATSAIESLNITSSEPSTEATNSESLRAMLMKIEGELSKFAEQNENLYVMLVRIVKVLPTLKENQVGQVYKLVMSMVERKPA